MKEHFKKLEKMYHEAPINHFYHPTLTVSQGEARLRIPIRPEFFHAAGATHGSVYFKALDDAAFFAANSLVEDFFVLTVSFNMYLFKPISTGEILAEGRVVQQSKSAFIAEAILLDSEKNQIARGSGSFVRSQVKLTPEIGYRYEPY